jgi:hypothetical protein
MRRRLTALAALLLALFALPALVAADDKDKDKKDPPPDAKKDADKKDDANIEKTIKAGTLPGKVVGVNETAKSLTIEVSYEVSKPNAGEIQAVANAKANLAQAIARRDAGGIANAERDLAYHAARITQVEKQTKNVDITGTDDVKVRLSEPPPAFDDKGNIKKRTEKELKELKGDSKLPGYPGEWSDVRQGSYVKLSLVKKKEVHHTEPKPKDADPDPLGDNLPQASLIEVLAEPMPPK